MSADEMKYAFFIYMCAVVARSIRGAGVGDGGRHITQASRCILCLGRVHDWQKMKGKKENRNGN